MARCTNTTERFRWICECGQCNDDDIDPVYGPFITCTCGACEHSFDQDTVQHVD